MCSFSWPLLFPLSLSPCFHFSGAIGGIDSSSEQRADLARKSRTFTCSACGIEHATCPLAATPYTVKLDVEPQSPSLRAAGGAVKPATPSSSKAEAPHTPKPDHSPALAPSAVTAALPGAAVSSPLSVSSTSAVSSAVVAERQASVSHEGTPPVAPLPHPAQAAVPAPAHHAPPVTRTIPRASNNRAAQSSLPHNRVFHRSLSSGVGVDLYVAAFSVSSRLS